MAKFDRNIIMILSLLCLLSGVYWLKDKTINFTMFDKEQTPLEILKTDKLNELNNVSSWFMDNIIKVVESNKELIDKDNCKGLLYDQNNDELYDKKIFGVTLQNKSDYIVHYNFCSYIWNKDKKISLILTSKVLMNNFTETKGDLAYIPVMLFSQSIDTKLKDVSFGLLDTRDIM